MVTCTGNPKEIEHIIQSGERSQTSNFRHQAHVVFLFHKMKDIFDAMIGTFKVYIYISVQLISISCHCNFSESVQ